ncbi:MAG: hypothetical protein Q7R92_01915 [bacterium]|nr:hypothetical protein [bacterium]
MDGNEQSNYRQQLAAELKSAPKGKRRTILDTAQEEQQYWQSRSEKVKQTDEEKRSDDGMEIFLKKKTLFHGSARTGIDEFIPAEETTVGTGIYFTSEAKDAIGYARTRAQGEKDASPVIYEASVEDMKMLDLRKTENAKKIMDGFKVVLKKWVEKLFPEKFPNQMQYEVARDSAMSAIRTIEDGGYDAGNLRNVIKNPQGGIDFSDTFSRYVQSLGYDGLMTFEGGEGSLVTEHDTYLVFDPKKVKINKSHKIV